MSRSLFAAVLALGAVGAIPAAAATAATPSPSAPSARPEKASTPKISRVTVRGIEYAYQVRGRGEPLLVLHGGLGNSDMFEPVMPLLTANRQIIAVDLQGHGRSSLGKTPIRCEAIADDVAAVLKHAGRSKADVFGYSFGGCVALRLAIQHPQSVRRVVLVSTPYADDGWYAEMKPQQAAVSSDLMPMMKDTPMYKSYLAVAPKDEFPQLLDAMGDMMRHKYDWSADVAKLAKSNVTVMLVYADADMVRPEHEVKFYQLLGGGLKDAGWGRENMPRNRLAILPDLTHYDIFLSPRLAETVLPFLNAKDGEKSAIKSWAEQVKEPSGAGRK